MSSEKIQNGFRELKEKKIYEKIIRGYAMRFEIIINKILIA